MDATSSLFTKKRSRAEEEEDDTNELLPSSTIQKKQHHDNSKKKKTKLGVSEFCTILNNEQEKEEEESSSSSSSRRAKELIRVFKLFITTVRNERRSALLLPFLKERRRQIGEEEEEEEEEKDYYMNVDDSDDVDDDDYDSSSSSSSSDDESDDEQHSTKKSRTSTSTSSTTTKKQKNNNPNVKSWMADTKQWNNPFVGTSVSHTSIKNPLREYGTVKEKEWPCGLLSAYLGVSPKAVELLSHSSSSSSSSSKKEEEENEQEEQGTTKKSLSSSSSSSQKNDPWSYPNGKIFKSLKPKKGNNNNNNKNKNNNTSSSSSSSSQANEIYALYLQALAEIATAFVPHYFLILDLLWEEQKSLLLTTTTTTTTTTKKKEKEVMWFNQLILQHQLDKHKEEKENNHHNNHQYYPKISSLLHKKYIPLLVHLLNEETSYGKRTPPNTSSTKHKRGEEEKKKKKKQQEEGESLTACALHLLSTLSKTTTTTTTTITNTNSNSTTIFNNNNNNTNIAREVVKQMDESLHPNVLQICCNTPTPTTTPTRRRRRRRNKWNVLQTKSEYLRLASTLLEINNNDENEDEGDEVITSYITTMGNRERKQNAGLVTIALRNGLVYHQQQFSHQKTTTRTKRRRDGQNQEEEEEEKCVEDVHISMARFLSAVRRYLLPPPPPPAPEKWNEEEVKATEKTQKTKIVATTSSKRVHFVLGLRAMMDLLGGDALDRVTKLSLEAPPLTKSSSHKAVLSCCDTYKDENDGSLVGGIEFAAIEARRLLFPLLSDPRRSPFLVHLHAGFNRVASSAFLTSSPTHLQQHITRSIASPTIGVVGDKKGGGGTNITTLPVRAFLVYCISQTPQLLPTLFRIVPTTEPKPTFRCISSFACILHLMKECPPAFHCLPPLTLDSADGAPQRRLPPNAEQMISYILPMSTTKNILSKGVQSTNTLVVSETLKLIAAIIERSQTFVKDIKASASSFPSDAHDPFLSSFADALHRRLPDVQPLLAIRTRFDPFITSTQDASSLSEAANTFVAIHLCKVLQLYGEVIPQALQSVKFDWTKLLPDDSSLFLHAKPILQCCMLRTLQKLVSIRLSDAGTTVKFSSKAFCSLLTIVTNSNVPKVYTVARELALVAFLGSTAPDRTKEEVYHCLHYEASLWIDGVTSSAVSELSKLVDTSRSLIVKQKIITAQAWGRLRPNEPMPLLCFSPLLSSALGALSTSPGDSSSNFILLVCQVTTKLLLYHLDPTLLAVFICHCFKGTDVHDDGASPVNLLYSYAIALQERKNGSTDALGSLISSMFASNSVHAKILNLTVKPKSALQMKNKQLCAVDSVANEVDVETSLVIIRQCLHQLSHTNTSKERLEVRDSLQALLRSALVTVLQTKDKPSWNTALRALFAQNEAAIGVCSPDMGCHLFLALSRQFSLGEIWLDREAAVERCIQKSIKLSADIITAIEKDPSCAIPIDILKISTVALLGPLLPRSFLVPLVSALLLKCAKQRLEPKCSNEQQFYFSLTLSLMKRSIKGEAESFFDGTLLMKSVFSLWTSLALAMENGSLDSLSVRLCLEVEKILSGALVRAEDHGLASSVIFCASKEISPEMVIRHCMATISCTASQPELSIMGDTGPYTVLNKEALLPCLLYYDCLTFGPCFMAILGRLSQQPDVRRLWDQGILDSSVHVLTHQLVAQHSCSEILNTRLYADALELVAKRAQKLIDNVVKNEPSNSEFRSFVVFTDILKIIIPQGHVEEKILCSILSTLSARLLAKEKSNQQLNLQVEGKILIISKAIITAGFESHDNDVTLNHSRVTSTAVFLRLLAMLPKHLKNGLGIAGKSEGQCGELNLRDVLDYLILITEKVDAFDEELILSRARIVNRCLLICLKYGISGDDNPDSKWISCMCLRFVRHLVVKTFAPPYSLAVLSKNDVVNTMRIHAMLVSHSQFGSALSWKENSSLETDAKQCSWSTKRELVNLLVCCVSLCKDPIQIDADVWSSIIAGYNAGLCPIDCGLRRLMYLYDENTAQRNKSQEFIKLDELYWGKFHSKYSSSKAMETSASMDHARHWEWFITSLELDRIRATLIQFPAWDSLETRPDRNVETWKNVVGPMPDAGMTDAEEVEFDSSIENDGASDDSSMLSETDSCTEENNRVRDYGRQHNTPQFLFSDVTDTWRGSGPDKRYSPSFIMPLILGILEAFLPPSMRLTNNSAKEDTFDMYEKENEKGEKTDETITARYQSFAQIAHRLCDKGGVSLALASLSSKCPSLRKVAVAVLGLFLKAIHTKEAKDLTSWRERPQLAMILDSVQRGLTVRRAIQLLKNKSNHTTDDGHDSKSQSSLLIPLLPVVSAIFLARASLIISMPNHDMYSPINQLFLRLEYYHGAYQDCHSLPAFISFFCSSSEDNPVQARNERFWALQLLKDGTLDSYCYAIAARRHAPELLLTSFDTLATRVQHGGDDGERGLLLDTIESMLRFGGRSAASHLIGRMGLLSWLRGILEGRAVTTALHTITLRRKFLHLITHALEVTAREGTDAGISHDTVAMEASNLSRPVIEMYIETIHQLSSHKNSSSTHSKEPGCFLSDTCNTLWAISVVLDSAQSEIKHLFGSVRQQGISLQSASTLLSFSKSKADLLPRVVESLCVLPCAASVEEENILVQFCHDVLSFIQDNAESGSSAILHVLRRVTLLLRQYGDRLNSNNNITTQILACRCKSLSCIGGMKVWLGCLESVRACSSRSEMSEASTADEVSEYAISGKMIQAHGTEN